MIDWYWIEDFRTLPECPVKGWRIYYSWSGGEFWSFEKGKIEKFIWMFFSHKVRDFSKTTWMFLTWMLTTWQPSSSERSTQLAVWSHLLIEMEVIALFYNEIKWREQRDLYKMREKAGCLTVCPSQYIDRPWVKNCLHLLYQQTKIFSSSKTFSKLKVFFNATIPFWNLTCKWNVPQGNL